MRETVQVSVDDILSLASCAEDYGFGDDVLMDGLAEMLGYELSDEEIAGYAAGFLTEESRSQGYSEEDAETVAERLAMWRGRYFDSGRARSFKANKP